MAARFSALLMMALTSIAFSQVVISSEASAQQAECQKLGSLMQARGGLIAKIQGFQKKKPTAPVACSAFGELASNTDKVIAELQTNGDWCHAPAEALSGMQAQKTQIASARTNACNAAAQMKKMEQQQAKQQQMQQKQGGGPIGGGGDVLGGSIKVPQGAL